MLAKRVTQDPGRMLSSEEAAQRMGVSVDFLRTIALRGELQSLKIGTLPGRRGGRRLFPESEVLGWINRHLRAA